MLSGILKEHQKKQASHKQIQDVKRQEAMIASSNLVNALVDRLNNGVSQAYVQQKRLDSETKQLHANAQLFAKQTAQWLKLIDGFNSALKEVGDVENWARTMENDMRTIHQALELAYEQHDQIQQM